jgi:hypothetical protein
MRDTPKAGELFFLKRERVLSSATANGLRDYRMYSIPSAAARILR